MAPDDNSGGAKPAGPVVLRIKLRYDDLDAMVQRFAPNVGKSGLFLPTKSIQPIGTEVKFELRLSNDTPALVGIGRVKFVKPPDPANPRAAFGMAIELMRVSREGREVIIRMIERRRAMGLPDVAIPIPEDTDTARRGEVDSQPRADTSGIVREAMAQFASAPVAEVVLTAAPQSGPIAVAKEPSVPIAAPVAIAKEPSVPLASVSNAAPLMTSARDSGPISRAASRSVPVLAPEPPRAKRPRVSDLIAKAAELSGPLASVPLPGLDEHVDVERALTRARALAGGDLEAELAAVRESAAAPTEISIEAASAELARQLGGNATTKRDRSQRWAPPPAIEMKSTDSAVEKPFDDKTRAETEAGAAAVIASVIDRAVEAAPPPDPAPVTEPSHEQQAGADDSGVQVLDADDAILESAPSIVVPPAEPAIEVAPATHSEPAIELPLSEREAAALLIDDTADPSSFERAFSEGERLNTGDFIAIEDEERGESTQIGSMPVDPEAFNAHGQPTMPDQLEDQLDRQLAMAEQEAEDEFAQGMQQEYPRAQSQVPAESDEEISDVDVLAEADEDDADLLTSDGEGDASRSHDAAPAYEDPPAAYAQPQAGYDPGNPAYGEYREPAQEDPAPGYYDDQAASFQEPIPDPDPRYDDFAERPSEESDYSIPPAPAPSYEAAPSEESDYSIPAAPPAEYVERPSHSDFAARLDLDDDEIAPEDEFADERAGNRHASYSEAQAAGHAQQRESAERRAYEEQQRAYEAQRRRAPSASDYPDPPSSSYTFAEQFPQAGLDAPESDLDRALAGADDDEGEDFDEPHGYAQQAAPPPAARAAAPSTPPPPSSFDIPTARPGARKAAGDDLEDALSTLDVDLDDINVERPRRPSPSGQQRTSASGSRPLPGLPIHRPTTGPVRTVAHTVQRAASKPGTTAPPPLPAAAIRKPPTQQVPVTPAPAPAAPLRASTDDGVLIDFDDDE